MKYKVKSRFLLLIIVLPQLNICMDTLLYRRDLLVLLDWTEESIKLGIQGKGLGAVTNDLIEALYHESAPIVCSSTLWLNIVQQASFFIDLLFHNPKIIRSKYLAIAENYKAKKCCSFSR